VARLAVAPLFGPVSVPMLLPVPLAELFGGFATAESAWVALAMVMAIVEVLAPPVLYRPQRQGL
jgi:hypothetical protein